MKLHFTKMHGLGNDMIVLDSLASGFRPSTEQARFLCDRRFGAGADQILVLLTSTMADYRMRILNSDGSEVEMCGNGIRCLARYLWERGISTQNPLAVETLAGVIRPERDGEMIRVDMGEPVFDPTKVPAFGDEKIVEKKLGVDGHELLVSVLSMGNPHCVARVEDVDSVPLAEIGPRIERHAWFPKKTNVEFVQVLARDHLKVRVWERGAGVTLACGTGASASAVAMMDLDLIDRETKVTLPGGDLTIRWDRDSNRVFMTGPAAFVYDGVIELT